MNSLERMIAVLDLFEDDALRWTVEEMHARLGYTRSTLYRYLKVLTDAGFLTSLPDVGYTLGPRVIELDYRIRSRDPLLMASRPVMAELVKEVPGIALLCQRYRDKVLCVHQERSTDAFRSTYERGRGRPLLRGAASRIILAHLPAQRIARLFASQQADFTEAGLGGTLTDVKRTLKAIRQTGTDVTAGDVTAGVTGIAAPIFDSRSSILGSLSITIAQKHANPVRLSALRERVAFCAGIVTQALASASE